MHALTRRYGVLFLSLVIGLAAAGCTETDTGYIALVFPAGPDGYSRQTLELIQCNLEGWDVVVDAALDGLPEQAFDIEFNREKLRAFGLDYDEVAAQAQAQVQEKAADLSRAQDFNLIRIKTKEGYEISLSQIAEISIRAGENRVFYQGKQVYRIIVHYRKDSRARLLEEIEAFKTRTGIRFPVVMLKDAELYLHLLASERGQDADRAADWFLEHAWETREPVLDLVKKAEYNTATPRAVRLLGRMGVDADVEVLKDLVSGGPRWLLNDAVLALAQHPAEGAFTALVEFTADPDPETAAACVSALGRRKEERARPRLEALLESPSASIRYEAVHALSLLGAGPSRAALETRLAREPSAEVRALIQRVIE
jgi:hypothetical protein